MQTPICLLYPVTSWLSKFLNLSSGLLFTAGGHFVSTEGISNYCHDLASSVLSARRRTRRERADHHLCDSKSFPLHSQHKLDHKCLSRFPQVEAPQTERA